MMTDTYRKTKDVHKGPGLWLLRFKDSVSAGTGSPDAGGNEVVGSEPGAARRRWRSRLDPRSWNGRLPTHCRGAADGGC